MGPKAVHRTSSLQKGMGDEHYFICLHSSTVLVLIVTWPMRREGETILEVGKTAVIQTNTTALL